MISLRTQAKLSQLIQCIATGEKQTEITRQVLAEQYQFEPHTAFRRIDANRDQYITQSEIMDFLETNNLIVTSKEAFHLFNVLDFNDDGIVDYQDFSESILPQENIKLKTRAKLRDPYYIAPYEKLPYEVEWSLVRVLEQEIKNFRQVEMLRELLQTACDFDTIECFNAIDADKLGVIDLESINYFMREMGCPLSEDEILAFIRVVGNGELQRISYSQFSQLLNPLRIPTKLSYANFPAKRSTSATRSYYTSPKRQEQHDADYYNYLSQSVNRQLERSRMHRMDFSPRSTH